MSESMSAHPNKAKDEAPFASNALRLDWFQWLAVLALLIALYYGLPLAWNRAEAFRPEADYRIPYGLSSDYWHYARYSSVVSATDKIALLGDSVVWGQYVTENQSLSHFLNVQAGSDRFANLGVNGIHPVALAGLIWYYGQEIEGRKVVLHFNPLWMSSKRHDLQDERARRFNHPRLVPQFYPRIPSYDASFSDRLTTMVDRESSFLAWTDHVRIAYYENQNVPQWTFAHPYANPFAPITFHLPQDGSKPPSDPIPWTQRDLKAQDFDWVPLDASFQWRYFKETLQTLVNRKNEVYVVLGPFNEHLLTPASLGLYADLRGQIEKWLRENGVPYSAPSALPSELYADASHPLSQGYALLAKRLMDDPAFRAFAAGPG